ncbi:extracellular solute-binding protein [Paenibacillus sp. R14(2021)]|uniref:extracellular solute-binding protein n=1 Tax=Paenibacillus sp. R14(2021) TaxID=2859228 RepID=UPI001C613C83|nr:extracellular solute-binding protein [Paenibacillus sp. R14(2021)]
MRKAALLMLSIIIASSMAACESGTKSAGGNAAADGTAGNDTIVDGKMKDEVVISIPKVVDPNAKQGAGNLPPGDSDDNNQFTRYVKEKLNISFKAAFTTAPEAYDQKLSLAMASNELPDVTVVAEDDFKKLVENGQVEDLTAVYNKYASPTLKKIYDSTNGRSLKQATVDGKLMAIPNVNTMADFTNMLWVRKDWLDKLGLKEPRTLDDIITVAKAFIEKDPDGNGQADTMGLPGPSKNSPLVTNDKNHYFGFEQIFALDHAFPGMWVKNDKGEIEYGSIQPQAKKGLELLQKMYKDGVIDNQFVFRDDPSQFVKSGKAGMFFGPWWMPLGMLQDAVKNDPKAEWISILAPFGADGTYTTNRGSASGDFVVLKKGFQHPEALILYMNLYGANLVGEDPEGAQKLDPNVDLGYWPIRMTLEYGDKVERTSIEVQGVIDGKNKPESLDPVKKSIYDAYMRDQKNPRKVVPDWALASSWLASGKVLSQPMNIMNNEFTGTTESMIQKWATLSKLENETYLKIVMGQLDIGAFDDFVKKWTELGGEQVTQEVRELAGK